MTDNTEENNHKIKSNKSEFIGFLNGYDIEKSKEAIAFAEWIRVKDSDNTCEENWIEHYTTEELFEKFKKQK